MSFAPVPGVLEVEVVAGAQAADDGAFDLLVEVPHGADERAHYDALRGQLKGELPEDLHCFFHINTDVGAWAYGRQTAEAVVRARPQTRALLLRCLIPRTFVDTNRSVEFTGGDLDKGGLTAGIPAYVCDEDDRRLLLELHAAYVSVVKRAYEEVCGAGGLALIPHTYGPHTLGIASVDDDIVEQLRWACEPERLATWPVRAEVDLLTRDKVGQELSPPGMEGRLLKDFARAGFAPKANDTYFLHEATLAWRWATQYPGQTLGLEVRRDLLVEAWRPFEEMRATDEAAARVGAVLAPALVDELARLRGS